MQVVMHVLSPLLRPFPAVLRMVQVDEFELLVMIENVNNLFELSHIHLSGMTCHAQSSPLLRRSVFVRMLSIIRGSVQTDRFYCALLLACGCAADGLRRHIRDLQHKMVECDAWRTNSVLLKYLKEPVLAGVLNKESASVESLRPFPHRCQLPPTSPARSTMAPPESPLRVGKHTGRRVRSFARCMHMHACWCTEPCHTPHASLQHAGARLPPRHPGTGQGRGGAAAGANKEGAGEAGAASPLPNITRQVQAFARRFWLRARDVLEFLLSRLRKDGIRCGCTVLCEKTMCTLVC